MNYRQVAGVLGGIPQLKGRRECTGLQRSCKTFALNGPDHTEWAPCSPEPVFFALATDATGRRSFDPDSTRSTLAKGWSAYTGSESL